MPKAFVTADHGFGRVGREKIWFNAGELNEPGDCSYLNCRLRIPLEETSIPSHLRKNITSLTHLQLRMPESESVVKANQVIKKEYASIVFPRVGYDFSRSGSPSLRIS